MDAGELQQMHGCLQQVLGQDNEARKQAETNLNTLKQSNADKYAIYLIEIIKSNETSEEIRSLAAVILRRNISYTAIDSQDLQNAENNENLWKRMSAESQAKLTSDALEILKQQLSRSLISKVSNLVIEISGTIYEVSKTPWTDLMKLLYEFVGTGNSDQKYAALTIFNGLFGYMMDIFIKNQDELFQIFDSTLSDAELEVQLASLQALSQYLQIAERADTKKFTPLLEKMTLVVKTAFEKDEETILEDALVEFNDIADVEPRYFKQNFKDLFGILKVIVNKNDFCNPVIRQQPVEFEVTVVERIPSIVKKDEALLKDLIELIFQLMIDIDSDIDNSWLTPKEGFRADEEDEEEDNVNFGKSCIDRLVSSIGEEKMMPLLGVIVTNTIANDNDWRYKNASLMAFSQVGEYIDDTEKIAQMMPIVFQHLSHNNPKVRYAACHCIGQISDDMSGDYQDAFHEMTIKSLITVLDDPVQRVQAHACAALGNFFEGAEHHMVEPYMQVLIQKFSGLIQNGISIVKENAVTALAALAEAAKEDFSQYFKDCIEFLTGYLMQFNEKAYKQFRGQVIEAITIIASSVGAETFKPYSPQVIKAMCEVQNTQLDSKDPQRTYLLSAWQRICLLLGQDFAPYLGDVIPGIFTMASLTPSMGIQGQEQMADLTDMLSEVKPATDDDKKKKVNINTDEIEEKDVGIQMLAVFIDELGASFLPYIEQTSKLFCGLAQYDTSDAIRQSIAGGFPGLVKCAKEAQQGDLMVASAKEYLQCLWNAMEVETETETLICQIQSYKEILEISESMLFNQDQVTTVTNKLLESLKKSDDRIEENNKLYKEQEAEDEDEELDEEDLAMLKEENKLEYDLQLSIAEVFGILFKHHKQFCGPITDSLLTTVLPQMIQIDEKNKKKFALFVMDDMVEFLGVDMLGVDRYNQVVQQIVLHCEHPLAAVRQAAAYGAGIIAQHSGAQFAGMSQQVLAGIEKAVKYQMPPTTKGKQSKEKQFYHARDNAVSAIAKVIKYQNTSIDVTQYLPSFLEQLPIKHDVEEAKFCNELLSEMLANDAAAVCGASGERLEQVVMILGEICQKKYADEATLQRLGQFVQKASGDANFVSVCEAKLKEESKIRLQEAVKHA